MHLSHPFPRDHEAGRGFGTPYLDEPDEPTEAPPYDPALDEPDDEALGLEPDLPLDADPSPVTAEMVRELRAILGSPRRTLPTLVRFDVPVVDVVKVARPDTEDWTSNQAKVKLARTLTYFRTLAIQIAKDNAAGEGWTVLRVAEVIDLGEYAITVALEVNL